MTLLPETKSIPENDLKKYLILIYGRPGVGKTTLAAQFDDPLCLMFEPGAKSLSVFKKDITSWSMFCEVVKELRTSKRFQTVVIDTLAVAYDMCLQHVSKENGVEHPSELGYGKGWNAVETEFNKQLNKIIVTHRGIVLISHADDKEIEQFDGTVKTMTAPDLPKQAMRFIDRSVDILAYYYYGKHDSRYIRVQATDEIVAKNRIKGHFEGVTKFKAGTDEVQAYKNFIAAFENKEIKETNNAESGKTSESKNSKGVLRYKFRT